MLSNYQLKIFELFNIHVGTVKNVLHNFFNKEKYVLHYKNLQPYLRLWEKTKMMHRMLDFGQ